MTVCLLAYITASVSNFHIFFTEIIHGCTYEVINASVAEEKIREEVVAEIATVLETIGVPIATTILSSPLSDDPGSGNGTTDEPPLRIAYKELVKEFEVQETDGGYNNFTEAISQITEAKLAACEATGGVSAADIPSLANEYRALRENVEANIEEMREIFGKMLCLSERDHEERKRKKRDFHCPGFGEECFCPETGEIACVCEFFRCLDPDNDIKPILGLIDVNVPEGLPCLAFTVDTTGSMGEEIAAVSEVIRDFLSSEEDGPGCYVLQPFNDHRDGEYDDTSKFAIQYTDTELNAHNIYIYRHSSCKSSNYL